jgi:drug/metabolite transporter (DMT)-like permease
MTLKYFVLTIIVTFLLAVAQVLVKLGVDNIGELHINIKTLISDISPIISSYYLWLGAITVIVSSVLWMKVLSKVDLSVAYPLISISYIFGLLASKFILGESISPVRWVGVGVIAIGIVLLTRG